jgi:hypothetical protein
MSVATYGARTATVAPAPKDDGALMGFEISFSNINTNASVNQEDGFGLIDIVCATMFLLSFLSQSSFGLREQTETFVSRLLLPSTIETWLVVFDASVDRLRDKTPRWSRMLKAVGPTESPNTTKLPSSMLRPRIVVFLFSISG